MRNLKRKGNQRKKAKIINTVLIIAIVLCVGFLMFLLVLDNKMLTPDYASGTIDINAIKEDDDGKKMDISEGGGAVSLSYSNVVSVNLKNKLVKLYLKNPSKSREDATIQLVIEQKGKEVVIAKSDLIPPGYAIYKLKLKKGVYLQKGGYDGKFKINYYNEETGRKEIVDTEIEVSIEVE